MKKLMLLVLSLLLFSTVSFTATIPSLTDLTKPILINNTTPIFTVNLNSNPTTGYGWRLKSYDPSLITPINQTFIPPNTNLVGAGGMESFTFKVMPPMHSVKRVSQVTFIYVRPWNMDIGKTVTVNLITQ